MKHFLLTLLLAASSLFAFSQIKSATLTASGLTCSMCSKAIYKTLLKLPYVAAVDVDMDKSVYLIQFKPGSNANPDGLKTAVEKAGFFVASLKIKATIPTTEVYNDAHVNIGGSTYHFLAVNKQTLSGDRELTIVDKSFLPIADYKKYRSHTKMKCIETGYMAACCPSASNSKQRVYHVTL